MMIVMTIVVRMIKMIVLQPSARLLLKSQTVNQSESRFINPVGLKAKAD